MEPVKPENSDRWPEVEQYIKETWLDFVEQDSSLPKPYSYALNPGTLYYSDLYFINEGLCMHGYFEQARNNIDCFAFEIEQLGFIPNANKWGTQRSMTPYFAMMVRHYYEKTSVKDKVWLEKMYHAVVKEYEFWTNTNGNTIEDHSTSIPGLQRYSHHATPEELIEFHDQIAHRVGSNKQVADTVKLRIANQLSAESESTMDYTPRFEERCLDFIAVDLNCNLYQYEKNLAFFERELGLGNGSKWEKAAKKRASLINKYLWNPERGIYLDYDYVNHRHSRVASTATFYPLCWGIASKKQAQSVCNQIGLFESFGGLTTCEENPERVVFQWGKSTVWGPPQFIAMDGLMRYGFKDEAQQVAIRWLNTVTRNYIDPKPVRFREFKKRVHEDRQPGFIWEKFTREGTINDHEYYASVMMGFSAATYLKALRVLGK